jgi:hypothetical protein
MKRWATITSDRAFHRRALRKIDITENELLAALEHLLSLHPHGHGPLQGHGMPEFP